MDQQLTNKKWVVQNVANLLPTLTLGMASVCLVFGLLIVNLRLAKYGVFSVEFLRTDYILIGAVFIFLVLIVSLSIKATIKEFGVAILFWKEKKRLRGAIILPLAIITGIGPTYLILAYIMGVGEWASWAEVRGVMLLVLFVGGIIYAAYSKISALLHDSKAGYELILGSKDNQQKDKKALEHVSELIMVVPLLLIAVTAYANGVYPKISTAWGGGNKALMMLFSTPNGVEVCRDLALPIMNEKPIVGPVKILTESEKEITVLVQDDVSGKELAIRLNRDLFYAIQTLSPRR